MGGSIQGTALQLTPTVSTFAGTAGGTNGTGAAARFNAPMGIASDGTYLYVADPTENQIRRIEISTGAVTTLAGTGAQGALDGEGTAATFSSPDGIAFVGANLYVTEVGNNKIRQIVIATGAVSSFTGVSNTSMNSGAEDGAASAATFNGPYGITTDGTNLYVADSGNNKIRKIVIATGAVSSFTGALSTAGTPGFADGAAAGATFNTPIGITADSTNLYVTDTGNNKIRKILIATGAVSSFTGMTNSASTQGAADGAAASATFNQPWGLTTDGTNLYVADCSNNKIRKISSGTVSSLTGEPNLACTAGAADGSATAATFNSPTYIFTDGTNAYVSDYFNATIRQIILLSGTVSTLAGTPVGADGTGRAAAFNQPEYITTDGTNLYVADTNNNKIRKIVIATGVVTTLAGSGEYGAADGAGLTATFNHPCGITTDGTNLYVTDVYNYKIRQIVIATGMVSSLTGTANTPSTLGVSDGPGSGATFNGVSGITTDGTNLYVADTGNQKIRKIVIATGVVSSFTGAASIASTAGAVDGPSSGATFNFPRGITTDGTNLYVADTSNFKIRMIVIATGVVSSFTGTSDTVGTVGAMDGSAVSATFAAPFDITSDGTNLYIVDMNNDKIRKIVIATGVVSSVTGTADSRSAEGAADGPGAMATFNYPYGITTDGTALYVPDTGNDTIRKIQ
jgi:sugar lactone lactonase YvrE